MSEIIAETNGRQGILIADTMLTLFGENEEVIEKWDERKIYGTQRGRMINACMGNATIGHDTIDMLDNMEVIRIRDLYRVYDEQLKYWESQGVKDLNSIVFTMYAKDDKVRIVYATQNDEKILYELLNEKKVVVPGDTNHVSYIKEIDLQNICSKEHLAELVREFIEISEQSQFVSDTCCIATMNYWGIIQYYEDNMYKMLENIEKGTLKSNIGILAQSTPKFIRSGIQKPIP